MIKEIDKRDISECVKVIRLSFLSVAKKFGITKKNAPGFTAFSTTRNSLKNELRNENRKMYAYYLEGKIIGCYSLLRQNDFECELNNLCVLPDYRNKYIGRQLLLSAFDNALIMGCVKINIGIIEENIALLNWYERFGFVHTDTKKFEFFPFTCGYMVKELTK